MRDNAERLQGGMMHLPVRYRVAMLRAEHPDWQILCDAPVYECGLWRARVLVTFAEGAPMGTSCSISADSWEAAENRAIGRACALAGTRHLGARGVQPGLGVRREA